MLIHVTANDVDLNPSLTYDFASSGNPGDVFSIDRFSGKISLAKELDYEVKTEYILTVKVNILYELQNVIILTKLLNNFQNFYMYVCIETLYFCIAGIRQRK